MSLTAERLGISRNTLVSSLQAPRHSIEANCRSPNLPPPSGDPKATRLWHAICMLFWCRSNTAGH
jgi:hypothetical protein